MVVLAHLSDIHLPTPGGARPTALANKRALGYLSWRLRRRRIHRPEVLAALVRDLKDRSPTHVVITGDLVNVSLPVEFEAAAAWLADLGPPAMVTVIPGNHDAYVATGTGPAWSLWRPFMTGDDTVGGGGCPSEPREHSHLAFPFLRCRSGVALIGLSTAQPSLPGMAYGRVGLAQRQALAALLAESGARGCFRVVLIHHPPVGEGVPWHKRLRDTAAFADVIARTGAELILHGHQHRFSMHDMRGPHGSVPVIGVPSASVHPGPGLEAAQYHLYGIGIEGECWTLQIRRRTFDATTGAFVERPVSTRRLSRPHPATKQAGFVPSAAFTEAS